MCIRDRSEVLVAGFHQMAPPLAEQQTLLRVGARLARHRLTCLLYRSDAADERSSVDLGGRRIIKKKKNDKLYSPLSLYTHTIT